MHDTTDQLTVTMALEMFSDMAGSGPWAKFAGKANHAWRRLLPLTRPLRPSRTWREEPPEARA